MDIRAILNRGSIPAADYKKLISSPEQLRLVCHSCNWEWMKARPKGYYVRYKEGNNYLVNRHFPCVIEYFKCPNCGNTGGIGRLTAGRIFHS